MSDNTIVYVDIDLEELIPDFMENRKNDVTLIYQHLQNGEIDEIMRLGHSMKGSGGGYGFDKITEIGAEMEDAAKVGNLDKISKANAQLNNYLQKVKIVWQEED